jgi:hypothetical protein
VSGGCQHCLYFDCANAHQNDARESTLDLSGENSQLLGFNQFKKNVKATSCVCRGA